jgi:hypothetical protein
MTVLTEIPDLAQTTVVSDRWSSMKKNHHRTHQIWLEDADVVLPTTGIVPKHLNLVSTHNQSLFSILSPSGREGGRGIG